MHWGTQRERQRGRKKSEELIAGKGARNVDGDAHGLCVQVLPRHLQMHDLRWAAQSLQASVSSLDSQKMESCSLKVVGRERRQYLPSG